MSQLIALIIAIALGAIVTAIGYVFLGDAFTQNSERGVALQFVNQGSQVEMAMTAFRAENARTSFDTDWDTTRVDGTNNDGLVDTGYLKDGLVAPQGAYSLVQDGTDVFLVVDSALLTQAVCTQIARLSGDDVNANGYTLPAAATAGASDVNTALNGERYGCFTNTGTSGNHVFAYEVE